MSTWRVSLKTRMAGPGGCYEPGQVIAVNEGLASDLISGGYAVLISKPEPEPRIIEEAVVAPPETAVIKRRNPASRKGR